MELSCQLPDRAQQKIPACAHDFNVDRIKFPPSRREREVTKRKNDGAKRQK